MNYAITESEDTTNLPMCKEIAEHLVFAYPGYTWHVRIDGGLLIIKNLSIHQQWGMVRKFSDIAHDAARRKHDVVMAAGEFLERAHLQQAAQEGELAETLEGVENFKPLTRLQ